MNTVVRVTCSLFLAKSNQSEKWDYVTVLISWTENVFPSQQLAMVGFLFLQYPPVFTRRSAIVAR